MSDLHRPKKVHRTLVWGGWYGSRNIGDTAILLGIKEMYKKINHDRHYYLGYLSTDIDYTNTNGVSGKRALVKADIIKPWNWIKLFNVFREADRVIISGGTPIFDFSHQIRSIYMFLPVLLRKPYLLFGAGVKPIRSRYGKKYLPYVLNRADYRSVRDQGSKEVLDELGVNNVVKTADSAFFAPSAVRDELEPVLQKYGISWQDKILVVAPRLMSPDKKKLYLDEDMSKKLIEEVPKKMAKAIDAVAEEYDRVAFMAMHYYGPDSDVELIREIINHTKTDKAVFVEEELRPRVGIALMKHAHVVFAMRLHALLLASSMYTPAVGIAYEKKVEDLFARLELKENVVSLFNFSSDNLIEILKSTYNNREGQKKHLEKRVKKLRKLILNDAEKVLRIDKEYSL